MSTCCICDNDPCSCTENWIKEDLRELRKEVDELHVKIAKLEMLVELHGKFFLEVLKDLQDQVYEKG